MKHCFLILTVLITGYIASKGQYMIVGTYDSPNSEGVYVYKFDTASGSATVISHVKTSNPSFIAVSPDNKYVYAANENGDSTGKAGSVTSFSFDRKKGTLSLLSSQSTRGNHPCYVTVDKTGKWLLAGNYSSGNFTIFPLKSGLIAKPVKTIDHKGSGPDTARQKSPHVHGIFMKKDNTGFFVTDLGTDKLMSYSFKAATGAIAPSASPFIDLGAGSGPRHLDFHPRLPLLYVLNELNGTVSVLKKWSNDAMAVIQNTPAFPLYFRGKAGSADIHISPDGKFLYCSNRGTLNNITIFSVDSSGMLKWAGDQPTLGSKPRNFNFDPSGRYLLVANQDSDEIVIFKRDILTGLLTDTGNRVSVGKPVCIKWIL